MLKISFLPIKPDANSIIEAEKGTHRSFLPNSIPL